MFVLITAAGDRRVFDLQKQYDEAYSYICSPFFGKEDFLWLSNIPEEGFPTLQWPQGQAAAVQAAIEELDLAIEELDLRLVLD